MLNLQGSRISAERIFSGSEIIRKGESTPTAIVRGLLLTRLGLSRSLLLSLQWSVTAMAVLVLPLQWTLKTLAIQMES